MNNAGFTLDRWWHYFSPASMRVLEWGHYFGIPSVFARVLTGKGTQGPTMIDLFRNILNPLDRVLYVKALDGYAPISVSARSISACVTAGGVAQSMSATHAGMTSALPNTARRLSYLTLCVPARSISRSKSNAPLKRCDPRL